MDSQEGRREPAVIKHMLCAKLDHVLCEGDHVTPGARAQMSLSQLLDITPWGSSFRFEWPGNPCRLRFWGCQRAALALVGCVREGQGPVDPCCAESGLRFLRGDPESHSQRAAPLPEPLFLPRVGLLPALSLFRTLRLCVCVCACAHLPVVGRGVNQPPPLRESQHHFSSFLRLSLCSPVFVLCLLKHKFWSLEPGCQLPQPLLHPASHMQTNRD